MIARLASPKKIALICVGKRYTYADLAARVVQLARLLHARGVKRGDRVALFLDKNVELVCGVYATLRIGNVFMPINSLTKQDKLTYLLNDARASVLTTHAALAGIWHGECSANSAVLTCLVADAEEEAAESTGR